MFKCLVLRNEVVSIGVKMVVKVEFTPMKTTKNS